MKSLCGKLLALCVIIFAASICFGQNITASLTGTVTDPSGAVVSGASVTLHNNDSNVDVIIVKTDASGVYTAGEVPVGTYTVSVEGSGFKKFVASEVTLYVGEHRTLDVKLSVGAVSESVTVSASTVPVETSTAAQEATITGTQIRELQLNNRNFEELVTLQPGVASSLPDQIPFGITNTDSVSVNGARVSANNWTVDGTDINDSGSNQTLLNVPSIDALDEFTLERSTYDAQYGRSGGGQVNVATKSGTNEFHGDAYEFVRNNVFDANEYFNKGAGNPRPAFRYNDFGYTVGGPVYIPNHYNTDKSKTFFFFSEEFRRTRTPSTDVLAIPNPEELTGSFAGIATLNPASAPAGCITNANTQINPACFSANAKAYIANVYSKFTPNSALSPTALTENYTFSVSAADDYRQEIIRLDHRITNKVQAFARYMQDKVPTQEPGGLFAGAGLPGISATSTNAPGRNFVAHVTMELSPTVMNEVAFGDSWGAINSKITGAIVDPAFLSAINESGFPFSDPYHRVPGISIRGVTGVGIPVSPYFERNIDKSVYDNVSITHGSHTIRTGMNLQLMRKTENAVNGTNGSFSFGTQYGNPAFANFLLGYASGFSQASRDIIPNLHFPNIEAYVQDDWKVRRNFTLNLGLRYAFLASPEDDNQILDNFSPAAFNPSAVPIIDPVTGQFAAGQVVTPSTYSNGIIIAQNACNPNAYFQPPVSPYGPTCSPYGLRINPVYHTFAPRLGFAWDIFGDGKTALRGGFGVYYDRTLNGIEEQNSFANPPFVGNANVSTPPNGTNIFDNPSKGGFATPLAPATLHSTGTPAFQVPYIEQWSLSVQREISHDTTAEIAYVGNRARRLLGELDLNQVPENVRVANPTDNTNAIRPYLGYGPITEIAPLFYSNYNSLQLSVNRRVAQGLTLGAAYTWSKTLTNNPTDRSSAPYDTYNFGADYGPADFSLAQVFGVSYVYELPFYRSQQGIVGHVLGGWEVSGITSFTTGSPTTIFQFNDPFNSFDWASGTPTYPGGIGIDPSVVTPRPDRVAGDSCSGPKTLTQYINTAAFTDAIGHFGSSGRGVCTGPGLNNWDISAIKNIKAGERLRFQFRAEMFNAFNHESFNSLDNYTDDSTFGQLLGGHDPRIIQLGLKLYF